MSLKDLEKSLKGIAIGICTLIGVGIVLHFCMSAATGQAIEPLTDSKTREWQRKQALERMAEKRACGEKCLAEIKAALPKLPVQVELPSYWSFPCEESCESGKKLLLESLSLIMAQYEAIGAEDVNCWSFGKIVYKQQLDWLNWPLVRMDVGNLIVYLPYHATCFLEMDYRLRNRYVMDLRTAVIIEDE